MLYEIELNTLEPTIEPLHTHPIVHLLLYLLTLFCFVLCSGLQVSDAGQLARASHGAIRGESYIAVRSFYILL